MAAILSAPGFQDCLNLKNVDFHDNQIGIFSTGAQ